MSEEQQTIIIPSNPVDRKEIADAMKEISNAKLRASSEDDYVKETITDLSKKHNIPKKMLNKIATAYHKQQAKAVLTEAEEFEALYDILFGSVK